MLAHQGGGGRRLARRESIEEGTVLFPPLAEMAVGVVAGFVGEAFVAPAAPDDFPHREIAAELRHDEMEGEVEPARGGLPAGTFSRFRVHHQRLQIGQDRLRDTARGGVGRLGFDQLTGAVQIDEPVLRPRPHRGALVQGLAHDPVGGEPGERLDHRGAAHPEVLGEAGAFQFRPGGEFAPHDAQEDAVVGFFREGATLRIDDVLPEEGAEFRIATRIENGR